MIYHLTMLSVLLVTITSGYKAGGGTRKRTKVAKRSKIQTGTCKTVEKTRGQKVVLLNEKKDNYTITWKKPGAEDIAVTSKIHKAIFEQKWVSPKAKTDEKHSQFYLKIYYHHKPKDQDGQKELVAGLKNIETQFKTSKSYLHFNIPYKYVEAEDAKEKRVKKIVGCLPNRLAEQFPETNLIDAIKSDETLKIRLKRHKGCGIQTVTTKGDVGNKQHLVTIATIRFREIANPKAKKKQETPMPVQTFTGTGDDAEGESNEDDLSSPLGSGPEKGSPLGSSSGSPLSSTLGSPKSPPSPPKSPPSPPKSPPSPPKSPPSPPKSPRSPPKSFTIDHISVADKHRRKKGDMSSTSKILVAKGYGAKTPEPTADDSDDEWNSDDKALAPNADPPIYKPQSPKVRAVSPPPLPIVESVTESPAEPKNETLLTPEPVREPKKFTTKRTCNPQEGPQYNDWTSDGQNQTAFFHANFSPDLRHLLSSIVHNKSAGNKAYQRHAGCARKSRAARKAARSIERTQDNRQHDENKFIPNRTLANGGQLIRRLSNDPRYDCSDGSVLTKDGYEALVLDSKKKGKSNSKGKDVFGPRFERKKRKVIRSMDLSNHGSAL